MLDVYIITGVVMVRTQVYLTEDEQNNLKGLVNQTGKPQSELIREAIDQFITKNQPLPRLTILKKAKGLWHNRTDLPDLRRLRTEFERYV
jgi:hypothetical protein